MIQAHAPEGSQKSRPLFVLFIVVCAAPGDCHYRAKGRIRPSLDPLSQGWAVSPCANADKISACPSRVIWVARHGFPQATPFDRPTRPRPSRVTWLPDTISPCLQSMPAIPRSPWCLGTRLPKERSMPAWHPLSSARSKARHRRYPNAVRPDALPLSRRPQQPVPSSP